MLDSDTKHRIDNARDILVGKVPDPKSQVEQITIALIYKFMSDMDSEVKLLGGKPTFFNGDYACYDWTKLMDKKLGGQEMLNLYSEALQKMNENPGIPVLFRDIFKNAYLPYRDPETLRSFLKEINTFNYDHSERLGDAFEYLLSVLGSQGDAGQFRTPRHIIDFMVQIVDPKKNEKILDPACGTAGFLISSFKHILNQNTDKKIGDKLSADDRKKIVNNVFGYDISPDMVRLSLVNLYLHGFSTPNIVEYDTLTNEGKWSEFADVILANPPFMTPKGGIHPHKRFSVQTNRCEVLFVDYIAEHLSPKGRAAIVVPDGVVFQSGSAYKQLRKMLVENYLVAVISLPAGVFNPYSGVKTSILILDKKLVKTKDDVMFIKINNDGFGLGAQRRSSEKNDLPEALKIIQNWFEPQREKSYRIQTNIAQAVSRDVIGKDGDYNLSSDRYRKTELTNTEFPIVKLSSVIMEMKPGFACGSSSIDIKGVPHLRPMNITEQGQIIFEGTKYIEESDFEGKEAYQLEKGDVLFNNTNSKELVGKTCIVETSMRCGFSNHLTRIRCDVNKCLPKFLAIVLHSCWERGVFLNMANKWIGQAGINTKTLSNLEFPLPSLDIQEEIIFEIEGYQKIINENKQLIEKFQQKIKGVIPRIWWDSQKDITIETECLIK